MNIYTFWCAVFMEVHCNDINTAATGIFRLLSFQ